MFFQDQKVKSNLRSRDVHIRGTILIYVYGCVDLIVVEKKVLLFLELIFFLNFHNVGVGVSKKIRRAPILVKNFGGLVC